VVSGSYVWLGVDSTLVRVNRYSGRVVYLRLPAVTVGARGSGLPQLPGAHPGDEAGVDALALGPEGLIVGRTFATQLQVVNVVSGAVAHIALPLGTALAGLTSDLASDGKVIGVVLYSSGGLHELGEYAHRAWSLARSPCATYAVSSSARGLIVSGPGCVARVTARKVGASVSSRDGQGTQLVESTGKVRIPCAVTVGPRSLLACTGRGGTLRMFGPHETSGPISLGVARPGPSIGGGATGSSSSAEVTPLLLSSTGRGRVWFVPAQGDGVVGLIQDS
jgi:hypothetical protein